MQAEGSTGVAPNTLCGPGEFALHDSVEYHTSELHDYHRHRERDEYSDQCKQVHQAADNLSTHVPLARLGSPSGGLGLRQCWAVPEAA